MEAKSSAKVSAAVLKSMINAEKMFPVRLNSPSSVKNVDLTLD